MRLQMPDWMSRQWWNSPFSRKPANNARRATDTAPQGFQVALKQLSQRERRLWISMAVITSLCAIAFLLSGWPSAHDGQYELIRVTPETAAPALLSLLLLLNFWILHRRAEVRRERKDLLAPAGDTVNADADADVAPEDPVTGLLNRAAAAQRLSKELARAKKQGRPLSVLVADIDGFREINRLHGEAAGDEVLREFAWQLRKASRGSDVIVRMSGDAFLAVLPDCNVASVQRVTDRITPMTVNCGGQEVEVSCSVSSFDHHHGDSAEELLKRADQMLKLYSASGSALAH